MVGKITKPKHSITPSFIPPDTLCHETVIFDLINFPTRTGSSIHDAGELSRPIFHSASRVREGVSIAIGLEAVSALTDGFPAL